jgi:hypothetical protein
LARRRKTAFHAVSGQSNSEAGGLNKIKPRRRVVTLGNVNANRALMLSTGYLGSESAHFDSKAVTGFVPGEEKERESGGASFSRKILADLDEIDGRLDSIVYQTFGQTGQMLKALSKGSVPFSNFIAGVVCASDITKRRGEVFEFHSYGFRHGEKDRKLVTPPNQYLTRLLALEADIRGDVSKKLRREFSPWMILCVLTAPVRGLISKPAITLAQVLAFERGKTIAPSCCPYWFNGPYGFIKGQAVHWTALGKALLVEYEARAARIVMEARKGNRGARSSQTITRHVFDGDRWTKQKVPFETSPRTDRRSVRISGKTIHGELFYAEGGLSIYPDYRGGAANSGFTWDGGEQIQKVEIDNSGARPRWILHFDAPPSPGSLLSYAITAQPGPADCGPSAYGDLFDNCREMSYAIPGFQLRQGMLPFRFRVGATAEAV